MSKKEYKELIAFHPGYYLKDIIEEMNVTQEEFAKRLGTTGKHLSDILKGKVKLSNDIAVNLSMMLGTSVDVWLNLQETYTKKVLEIERRQLEDKEAEMAEVLDYKYFTDLDLVPKARTKVEKAKELLKFFRISSFAVFKEPDFLVNYRCAVKEINEKNVINSNAWVQTAMNLAKEVETEDFNGKKLKKHIPEIREMTLRHPAEFLPRLEEIFKSCGVAFILLPHLKNSGINGAVKWIEKNKVMLAMNNRRNYADTFWFSLFHELGHVFQKKKKLFICSGNSGSYDLPEELETEADLFARNTLIPEAGYLKFINQGDFSESAIRRFANDANIHPGIVVGRLQKEEIIGYERFNRLKVRYVLTCPS